MERRHNRGAGGSAKPCQGFSEASAVFRGVAGGDASSADQRFAETTALVRAFSAIEDDSERARVLALARELAGLPQKP